MKSNELTNDGRQLRPKHVGAVINNWKYCETSWC